MRSRRRAVGEHERRSVEHALARNIQALGPYRCARTVGIYFAFDGEPSLDVLMNAANRQGKRLAAPVLLGNDMHFAQLSPYSSLKPNFFGILEPDPMEFVDARSLDLVLTPLVALDRRGVRLGVGRGYYDRCFRFLRDRRTWFRPKLLGIGYSFQQTAFIEMHAWDIPLWGAVTERGAQLFA